MSDLRNLPPLIGNRSTPLPKRTRGKEEATDTSLRSKKRAPLNFIPSPDQLEDMISNALTALRKGVYWDRGSILNIIL